MAAEASKQNNKSLPAVLTDFGGIGRELYSAIIQLAPPALDACVAASPNGRNFNNSARVTRTPRSTNPACSYGTCAFGLCFSRV